MVSARRVGTGQFRRPRHTECAYYLQSDALAAFGELAAGRGDAGSVESEFGKKLAALGVIDEAVGNAEPLDAAGFEAHFAGRFENGATKAAHEAAFFDRDDEAALADSSLDQVAIDGFDEAGVYDADLKPVGSEQVGGLDAVGQERAEAENGAVAAPAKRFGAAKLYRLAVAHSHRL